MQVTATLKRWKRGSGWYHSCYWGDVYNDIKSRWPDGQRIHTSSVRGKKDMGDHYLLLTLNSIYILPKNEEVRDDVGRSTILGE